MSGELPNANRFMANLLGGILGKLDRKHQLVSSLRDEALEDGNDLVVHECDQILVEIDGTKADAADLLQSVNDGCYINIPNTEEE